MTRDDAMDGVEPARMGAPMLQPSQRWWDDGNGEGAGRAPDPPREHAPAPAGDAASPSPEDGDGLGDGSAAIPDGAGSEWDFSRPPSIPPLASPDPSGPDPDPVPLRLVSDAEPDDAGAGAAVGRRARRTALVAGACSLALVVLVAGGVLAWRAAGDARAGQARSSCLEAAGSQADAWDMVGRAVEAAGEAREVDASKVDDPATVSDLAGLLDSIPQEPDGDACPAGADVRLLTAGETRADSQAKAYQRYAKRLEKAVAAVLKSRDAKTLADATTALKSKTDQASALLKDSDGRVQDNATRDALGKAIDQARTLLDAGVDAKAMNDASAALDRATAAVNDSMKAKSDADARAAAEAAAAQAAQQAPSYTPSYTPSYSGGGYAGGGSSWSGGSASQGGGSSPSGGGSPSWSVPPVDGGLPGSDPSL